MIGSVIRWIAEPVSSFVELGLGPPTTVPSTSAGEPASVAVAVAPEVRAPPAPAPMAPPPPTHAAISSGCTRRSSSPSNVNTSPSTATTKHRDPVLALSQRGPRRAQIEPPSSHAADTGTAPRLLPGDGPPGALSAPQPRMNRSRPSSRRQSNVASSGTASQPPTQAPTNLAC